jgi:hypothetical protein
MIPLRLVLQSVEKGLKVLTRKTEEMQEFLDNLVASDVGNKVKRAPGEKKTEAGGAAKTTAKQRSTKRRGKTTKALTDMDAVLSVIRKREVGATTAQIRESTGFSDQKIWGIVARAKKQGKIKSKKRGVYVGA